MSKRSELVGWWYGLKSAPSLRTRWWHIKSMIRLLLWREPPGQSTVKTGFGSMLIFILISAMLYLVFISNGNHAIERGHTDSQSIRTAFVANKDSNIIEYWYSLRRGTALALFQNENGSWSGLVHRITENNGTRWLGEEAYECTSFSASRKYWDNVIKRDGYQPLAGYPDISDMYLRWVFLQY